MLLDGTCVYGVRQKLKLFADLATENFQPESIIHITKMGVEQRHWLTVPLAECGISSECIKRKIK